MSTVNPLLRPPGAYLFQTPFKGGLIETGGGGLFNLEMMMVSVVHKELEYKVKKLKCKKLEVMQPRIKNKSELQLVNKPSWISPHEVLQL